MMVKELFVLVYLFIDTSIASDDLLTFDKTTLIGGNDESYAD